MIIQPRTFLAEPDYFEPMQILNVLLGWRAKKSPRINRVADLTKLARLVKPISGI